MGKEVEIRMKASDEKKLKDFLRGNAQQTLVNEVQVDTYFTPQHKNFLESNPVNEWLRIREFGNSGSITYKDWGFKDGKSTNICLELESRLDNPQAVRTILEKLDFKEIIIVKKTRNSYLCNNIEISVDEVENLGTFVELESKEDLPDEVRLENLKKLATQLELVDDEAIKLGYPIALLNKAK